MRRFVILLTLLAAGALLILGVASDVLCQGVLRVPRRPAKSPPAVGVTWRDAAVTARDGVVLRGWFAPAPGGGDGCVMAMHGVADTSASAAGFAPMFLSSGYSVLAPDSRAHGRSGGDLVTYGVLERHDALAWARWLRGQGCRRIYGLGESLGAAVLIQAAAIEPAFRAIVAECSYADLRTVGEYRVRRIAGRAAPLAGLLVESAIVYARLRYGLDLRDASPEAAIARASTPILLIHGLADVETPPENSRRLARANPRGPLWLAPGAGHVGAAAAAPAEFRRRVLAWFAAYR
jgi:dipeptidyl aminopeptidase/acylaminoacyl peptidase